MAPKILRAICNAICNERFGVLIHDEDEVVRDATVLGNELIHCICKVVHTLVWRIPDNRSATELRDEFSQQLCSIQTLHRQFDETATN